MKLLSTSNVKLKVYDVLPIENSEDILFYSYNNYLVRYAITQEKEIWRSKIKGEYASLSKGVFLEHFIVFEVIGNIEWLAVDLNTGEVHEFDKLHDSGALVSFSNHFIDFCYDVIDEETGEEKIEDDYYVYQGDYTRDRQVSR